MLLLVLRFARQDVARHNMSCKWTAAAAAAVAAAAAAAAATAASVSCKTHCCKTHYVLQFTGLLLIENSKIYQKYKNEASKVDVLEGKID